MIIGLPVCRGIDIYFAPAGAYSRLRSFTAGRCPALNLAPLPGLLNILRFSSEESDIQDLQNMQDRKTTRHGDESYTAPSELKV